MSKVRLVTAFMVAIVALTGAVSAQDEDRLHRVYIHGMPYNVAVSEARARSTRELLDMLMDTDQAQYWLNASKVLGFTGDTDAVEGLISFIEGDRERGFSIEWSPAMHRGRTSALMALGYAVNLHSSERAMGYLEDSVHAESWVSRSIGWLDDHPRVEILRRELCTTAAIGLALTGKRSAAEKLNQVVEDDMMNPRVRAVARSALIEMDEIMGVGLKRYHERRELKCFLETQENR